MAHQAHAGYVLTGTGHPHPLKLRPPTPPRNPPSLYGCVFVVCCASVAWVSWYGRLRWWCVPRLGVVGVAAWGWAGDPWPIRGQPLLVRVGAVAVACLRCAGRAGAALRRWFDSRASVGLWSWHRVSECVARIARGPSACTAVPAVVCPAGVLCLAHLAVLPFAGASEVCDGREHGHSVFLLPPASPVQSGKHLRSGVTPVTLRGLSGRPRRRCSSRDYAIPRLAVFCVSHPPPCFRRCFVQHNPCGNVLPATVRSI